MPSGSGLNAGDTGSGDWRGQSAGGSNPNDPGGAAGWYNGLKGFWNSFTGDPQGVMNAYNKAMQMAQTQGETTRNWLEQQQQKALQQYAPIQGIFNQMYGSGGIAPAKVPGAIGQNFSGGGGGY